MRKVDSSLFIVHRSKKSSNHEPISQSETYQTNYLPGQTLIIGIIFLAAILIISAALFSRVASYIHFNSRDITREQATNLAEAGLERTLWKLNTTAGACDESCTTETTLGTTGTFEVSIQNIGQNLKKITSTGYVPNKINPRSKRTIKVDVAIDTNIISFNYAVQVGTGGVFMENSSKITGTVWSNANIEGENSSLINGAAYATGTIANPPCTPGSPPSCVAHPNQPSPPPMPTVDYDEWKTKAEIGGMYSGSCTVTTTINLGPTKVPCANFTVQNFGEVTINGPVWVTGNVTIKNSAKIKLNESFGSQGTVLITDGKISTENSGAFVQTTASPAGYILAVSQSTANDAILVKNSGANAIFYALSGGASLENSARVTALVANRLETKNTATLTYELGLAGNEYSSGPGGSWVIKKGTYRFTQ